MSLELFAGMQMLKIKNYLLYKSTKFHHDKISKAYVMQENFGAYLVCKMQQFLIIVINLHYFLGKCLKILHKTLKTFWSTKLIS